MEFETYTIDGLTKKLHKLLKESEVDVDLVTRINHELGSRTSNRDHMEADEQIYWILKDTMFDKIHKVMVALEWSLCGGSRPPTITELIHTAENLLRRAAEAEQGDWYSYRISTAGFYVERTIYEGVMCLSLKFVVSGWDMDYEAVTEGNYSDTPYKHNWDTDDVASDIIDEDEDDD